jgi:hypothetical protein
LAAVSPSSSSWSPLAARVRIAFVVVVTLVAGCGSNVCAPYNSQPCIALHLRTAAGISLPPLDEIDVTIGGALAATSRKPGGGAAALPIVLAVLPGMPLSHAPLTITARAHGSVVGATEVMTSVGAAQHVDVEADFVSSSGGGPRDLGPLADGHVSVGAPCNLYLPASCGAGQKCTLANGAAFCVPDGTVAAGAACSGAPDDCVHGSVCVGGVCHVLCRNDGDCTQPAVNGVAPRCAVPLPGVVNQACTIACNPVAAAGASRCPSGTACVYTPSPTAEATDCTQPGSDAEGAACDNSTQCGPNLTCILNGAPPSSCRAVCRNGVTGDCPANHSCQTVGAQYGVCCPMSGC